MKKLIALLGFLLFALPAWAQQRTPPGFIPEVAFANLPTGSARGTVRVVTNTDGSGCNGDGGTRLLCEWTGANWIPMTGTVTISGAPTDATYITQTANGGLSAEQALSGIATGVLKVTNGTGVLSAGTAADVPNVPAGNIAATNVQTAINELDSEKASASTLSTHTSATDAHSATAANTASRIVMRDASNNFAAGTITANLTGNVTGNASGNAGTATALAADPSDCSAGQAPTGISASGAAQNCTAYQAADSDLTALAGNSTDGLWAHTGAGTGAARTIAGTAPIGVTDGAGTKGNPTVTCATCTTNAAALDANLPVIGGGSNAVATGTRSGNTTEFGTISGTKTAGKQLQFDASGNIAASGTDIGGSGGTITVKEADNTPTVTGVDTIIVSNNTLTDNGSGSVTITTGGGGGSGTVTSVATTSPITGGEITTTGTIACPTCATTTNGGALSATSPATISADGVIAVGNAAADGSTKGIASFVANDFDATSGNVGLDYTNGQKATGSVPGFLSSTDWTTFNDKVGTTRSISTSAPLGGGGNLSADRTLTCATCTTNAAALTSTAIMTGGGSQAAQTPSATTTLDSSGNISTPGTVTVGSGGAAAGEMFMYELGSNGSNYRSWVAPDSLTADLKLKFANAVPSAGDVMTWSAPSSSVSTQSWQSVASANTAGAIVARDGSGNFAGGTFTGSVTGVASGNATTGAVGSSGLTMSTNKLLGRSTAATGAIEEITLGTNLTWDGTTLNAAAGTGAPTDAHYLTTTAETGLSAEANLGALTTGMLKHTVSAGVSTPATASAGTDYVAPGATTTSGLTMATGKILGRTTAATGAIEELATVPDANLAADVKVVPCEITWGSKTSGATAIATDDDVPFVCSNLTGSTITVSSVECLADAANMTVDVVISGGSSILTGAVTCGNGTFAAATLSGTPTQANNGSLDVNIGTNASSAKYAVVRIKRTL